MESTHKRNLYVVSFVNKMIFVDTYLTTQELNYYIEFHLYSAFQQGTQCKLFDKIITLDEILDYDTCNRLQECNDIEEYRNMIFAYNKNYVFNYKISLIEDFLANNAYVLETHVPDRLDSIIAKTIGNKINSCEYDKEEIIEKFRKLIIGAEI